MPPNIRRTNIRSPLAQFGWGHRALAWIGHWMTRRKPGKSIKAIPPCLLDDVLSDERLLELRAPRFPADDGWTSKR